ncbi:MAG: EamA family transporter [Rhizobacter sp.]|nr:EamA family transporter [Rhizobacter sp.]
MSLPALALVVAAALLHALWNVVAKKAGGDARFSLLLTAFQVLLWSPLGLWLAWGVVPGWGWPEWSAVVASALANLVYFHTLLRGYASSDLTVVYPVARGTGPLLASLGALVLLGEAMSWAGGVGLVLVVAGVFLVAGGTSVWAQRHDPAQRRRVHAGVGWGAATGLSIATYTLIDGYAIKVLAIPPLLFVYLCNVVRLPMHMPAALHDLPAFVQAARTQWRHALLVAAMAPLAYLLVLYALRLAPLSHVAPAREMSMLFAALLGGRLLGEGERGPRIAGAVCIALGVAGLALG